MAHVGALPKIHRYITAHDKDGKAIFSDKFNDESEMKPNDDGLAFALSYTTKGMPVSMDNDEDLDVYGRYLKDAPGLVVSGGTVLRVRISGVQVLRICYRYVSSRRLLQSLRHCTQP
jgi:hypothetical protein